MEEAPKANPKLRNLPVPEPVMRCFLCGKTLVEDKGDLLDEAALAATGGIVILTCGEHVELARLLIDKNVEFIKAAVKEAKRREAQQDTKTE